jgi:predicted RNA polymerase sigma factor
MVHGPETGLEMLQELEDDTRLQGNHRLDAVRAHLYERAGNPDRALVHYRAAAERATSLPERNYLLTRAARIASASR